jgi:hypothetical protein
MRRGLAAIEATGSDPDCCSAERAPRSAGMFDMRSGRRLRMPPGRKHIVDRVTLGADLISEAERLFPDRVSFFFGRELRVAPPPPWGKFLISQLKDQQKSRMVFLRSAPDAGRLAQPCEPRDAMPSLCHDTSVVF